MMSFRPLLSWPLLIALVLGGCSPTAMLTPRDRYIRAQSLKAAGDSRAYVDELMSLAVDAPKSRAGRRARATLQSTSWMPMVIAAAAAAAAVEKFGGAQQTASGASAPSRLQEQAQQQLLQLHIAQTAHREKSGSYCTDVRPQYLNREGKGGAPSGEPSRCRLPALADSPYIFFLTPVYQLGGGPEQGLRRSRLAKAHAAIRELAIEPAMGENHYLFIAVGQLDGDDTLDIWTIDESAGEPLHIVNDNEG